MKVIAAAMRKPMASAVPLRDRAVAQSQIGQAEAMIAAARALMYETMAETWTRTKAGETLTVRAAHPHPDGGYARNPSRGRSDGHK